jgi:hypothetical protein
MMKKRSVPIHARKPGNEAGRALRKRRIFRRHAARPIIPSRGGSQPEQSF